MMKSDQEIWKEVDLRELNPKNQFWVSGWGRIKKTYYGSDNDIRTYQPPIGSDGYRKVIVKLKDGSSKNYALHRLVAQYFLDKPSEDARFVIHRDYNKLNNHPDNLKWVSSKENYKHCRRSEVWQQACRDNKFGASKLTEGKVKVIKRLLQNPKNNIKTIARQFNVRPRHIYRIRSGIRWGNITI